MPSCDLHIGRQFWTVLPLEAKLRCNRILEVSSWAIVLILLNFPCSDDGFRLMGLWIFISLGLFIASIWRTFKKLTRVKL
ncbi:hypothetical protein L2E82_32497 [Cichorium intybus]|uniref:Uncharacterized protein n=1 Tax=Cichorium intybus TaxID=13427 RepID=A0ACB9BG23_CICIN|nr:hypothetical protein L2E82_32497 [Cichorium intybus]